MDECCGITTVSGTESITTAMIAYRNRGESMGITHPELIVPVTGHVAFDKACDLFGIKIVKIPVDANYRVDLKLLKKAINSNTICIVGSFPNYAHGICDDIEQMSELAKKYNKPLHVDACLGGFLTSFYSHSNIKIPKFDFLLEGVTSLSADFHKYGLCPKGCSLLLYRNKEYRKHQYFFYPHWMGGTYPSPTMAGSRTPVMIVASYAVLIFYGKIKYIDQAKKIHNAIKDIKTTLASVCKDYNLSIIGDPQVCTIAFTGDNILHLYDQMVSKKWELRFISGPTGFHLTVTLSNYLNVTEHFCKDFIACCEEKLPKTKKKLDNSLLSETTKLYQMTSSLPYETTRKSLCEFVEHFLDN